METDVNDDLTSLLDDLQDNFVKLVEITENDVEIDDDCLDEEALKIPKLHQKYSVKLGKEMVNLTKISHLQKKIYMERWKYYNGKQTDKYYAKYGIMNEKILKSDIDKYLAADNRLSIANQILEVQKQIVNYLERIIKDLTNRGFHIKSCIEWRKFEAGV
ncbi:MAG: recombination mediator protein UvsY [Nitrosopumilaceae archaeon]|nr:recombination mediator protein UvsY [Nitrosopumilaceae archaeon]